MIVIRNILQPENQVLKALNLSSFLHILRKGKDVLCLHQERCRSLGQELRILNDQFLTPEEEILLFDSSVFIQDSKKVEVILDKTHLSRKSLCWIDDQSRIAAFGLKGQDLSSCQELAALLLEPVNKLKNAERFITLRLTHFWDLSRFDDLIRYVQSDFQLRHFNSLNASEETLEKSSLDLNKMKAEYLFYSFVPEVLRPYFTPSFGFSQNGDTASYKMERYPFLDASIQWVHGAFSQGEFEGFIKKFFSYISKREKTPVSKEVRLDSLENIYCKKVRVRQELLKKLSFFEALNRQVGLELLFERYYRAFEVRKHSLVDATPFHTILHGDLCLSNIMYYKELRLMKFIDPKGALTLEESLGDPIYDVVKLSHSILGRYDFINNFMAEVKLDKNLLPVMNLQAKTDPSFNEIFISTCKQALPVDVNDLRLLEASLFLSMLPLHSDHPDKVLMFCLQAKAILDDISDDKEKYVSVPGSIVDHSSNSHSLKQ